MIYDYLLNDAGEVTDTFLLVNMRNVPKYSLAALMLAVAHEAWHAWQKEVRYEAIAGRKVGIPLSGGPDRVSRATLYFLNFVIQVNPTTDGEEAYKQQLIEKEAFWFMDKVHRRIQDLIAERQDVAVAERFNHTL